jgi:hypothetical protein
MGKKLLLFLSIFVITSCSIYEQEINRQKENNFVLQTKVDCLIDSILVLSHDIDSLNKELSFWKVSFEDLKLTSENESYKDSFELAKEDLFVYKYKLERIKAYNTIVEKDNSQNVFFRGWVKRVLED